jgi:hypothetical protein
MDGAESVPAERAAPGVTTPETYLGWERAARFVERPQPGRRDFGDAEHALDPDQFALGGTWTIEDERAIAGPRARIDARVGARRVFLVMGSPDRARDVRVLVDGRPVRTVRVHAQRLYRLLDFGRVERRLVTLELDPGVAAYAFTFG